MRVRLRDSDQFGSEGPQKGDIGTVIGFTHGGESEETFFFVIFDGYNQYYIASPKSFGIYDGSGNAPVWRWLENALETEKHG